jgi:hypothetical protein
MREYKILTTTECTNIVIVMLMIISGLGSTLDLGELVWLWMGISLGETCQVVRQHWFEICHES